MLANKRPSSKQPPGHWQVPVTGPHLASAPLARMAPWILSWPEGFQEGGDLATRLC